ncbi:MAG TPA: DUF456 domain-containing protein [Xanthomonadales bacterium]|nr:DUF456 domain-containing protein [Xanthomonadales bacterium]
MDWTILWWVLAGLLVLAGLAGTVAPALPGVPLVMAGLFIGAWIGDFAAVGWLTLGLFALLTVLAQVVDFLASAFGVRYAGAGVRAFWGATIGAVVGIFFGLPGLLLGPFIGAVLGEISSGRSLAESGKAGMGAWLGMMLALAIKLAIAFLMIGIFIFVQAGTFSGT